MKHHSSGSGVKCCGSQFFEHVENVQIDFFYCERDTGSSNLSQFAHSVMCSMQCVPTGVPVLSFKTI